MESWAYPNGLACVPIIKNERNWEINVFFRGLGKSFIGISIVIIIQVYLLYHISIPEKHLLHMKISELLDLMAFPDTIFDIEDLMNYTYGCNRW